ncbi:MAG: AmmeMemoRadiSam system protein B, partial [Gammaproteobacteria bacterium]
SAAIAASAYRVIGDNAAQYSRVVLLGPAHRVYVEGIAIPGCDRFVFPGGEIPLDTAALQEIARLPGVRISDEAHAGEHCLEVQLPFLAAALGAFELVPFVVGPCDPSLVANALRAVWGGPETLIIVSSDLSHYLPYEEAAARDRATSAAIARRSSTLRGDEACGAHAINGLMTIARERDLHVKVLDVRNSGDTAGDHTRVVGYGAFTLR